MEDHNVDVRVLRSVGNSLPVRRFVELVLPLLVLVFELIPLKTRHQGRDASGHQDLFQRLENPDDPNSNSIWSQNYLNFSVENFNVEESGSLMDIIRAENNRFGVEDSNSNDGSGTL